MGRKLPKGGSLVGFVSPDGKDISLVIETTEAKGDQTLELKAAEGFAPGALHVWRTDMMEEFIPQPDLVDSNGTWTIKLNASCIYSLTTTTGQRKGVASSPPPASLPLPYSEDFEGYTLNDTPRYLCDQGGTFEVVAREDGGKCLRQQVHRQGINWANVNYAYSVIGEVCIQILFQISEKPLDSVWGIWRRIDNLTGPFFRQNLIDIAAMP